MPCRAVVWHSRAFILPKKLDMGIRYYYKNGKTGFQTSGGCHLTKACWDEAWLLDDTDRALVRDSEGYALLHIRSGQLIRLNCDRAAPYGDSLLRIHRNGKYGLLDFGGRTIIPPRYDVLTNHFAQFNIIGRRGRYGLLNRWGTTASLRRDSTRQPTRKRPFGLHPPAQGGVFVRLSSFSNPSPSSR